MLTEATVLDSDAAAIRFAIRHEGLELSPSLLDEARVPHRVAVDIGLENLSTVTLRNLLKAASEVREGSGASEEETRQATQRMLGAAAMLDPVFRVYDIAVDTNDVGVDVTAEANG